MVEEYKMFQAWKRSEEDEDQQLEQLINGQICFKIYPFLNGMVKTHCNINYYYFFILNPPPHVSIIVSSRGRTHDLPLLSSIYR